jgi:hypothetical protein
MIHHFCFPDSNNTLIKNIIHAVRLSFCLFCISLLHPQSSDFDSDSTGRIEAKQAVDIWLHSATYAEEEMLRGMLSVPSPARHRLGAAGASGTVTMCVSLPAAAGTE